MSWVTGVILKIGGWEDNEQRMSEINAFLETRYPKGFVGVDNPSLPDKWYGGDKYLEDGLYIGSFNYFPLQQFLKYLQSLPWQEPELVQVLVQEQEDQGFRIISIAPDSTSS